MSDVSSTAPAANEKPKLSNLEKLAAKEAKKAERAAQKQEKQAEKVAARTQKKADGWERKGRNDKGQKAYDFNSNTKNGNYVAFDENTVSASRRTKGIKKEAITRNMDTGAAARSRSWAGGIKRKTEYTEERVNQETGKREDVRTRKEKQNFAASKNVDYKENGAKTIERGTRKGMFSLTYTNKPDGSRSIDGIKLGPFKILRTRGVKGEKDEFAHKSFEISFGKSLKYSTSTDKDGNKTRSYKIGNVYSNSKTHDKDGKLVRTEKNYFGKRTKTEEHTKEGSSKYTTKGRSVNEMKRDGLDEAQIKEQIAKDIADGKVYRLRRTNERGEVTRDYNRQTYKGKTSDYIAGDKDTHDVSSRSTGFGLSKTTSQTLSREQIAARQERQKQLEVETKVASAPGAFPSDYSEGDKRMVRTASASSRVAGSDGVADSKDTDAQSIRSNASGKSSIASFATAATSSFRSMASGKSSVSSTETAKTSRTNASDMSTATTATANSQAPTLSKVQQKLAMYEERSREANNRPSL